MRQKLERGLLEFMRMAPMIATFLRRSKNMRDDVRGWQSDGIVDAILGNTNECHLASGELHDPRPIKRFGCAS